MLDFACLSLKYPYTFFFIFVFLLSFYWRSLCFCVISCSSNSSVLLFFMEFSMHQYYLVCRRYLFLLLYLIHIIYVIPSIVISFQALWSICLSSSSSTSKMFPCFHPYLQFLTILPWVFTQELGLKKIEIICILCMFLQSHSDDIFGHIEINSSAKYNFLYII